MNRRNLYKRLTKPMHTDLYKSVVKDFSTQVVAIVPMLMIDISVLGNITTKDFIDIWRQTGIIIIK